MIQQTTKEITAADLQRSIFDLKRDLVAYTTIISELIDTMKRKNAVVQVREKKFHDFLLKEYSKKTFARAYAFVYVHRLSTVRKLIIVLADTFEEATDIGSVVLKEENEMSSDWSIEGYQHINIPPMKESVSQVKIEAQKTVEKKPVDTYVASLMYARDNFAKAEEEKVVLEKIVKRVKQKHATK